MTAAPPEGWDGDGVRSLEVRWIFPGPLVAAMARWFGRFPVRMTALQDAYLVDPHLPGLSVKVRAGRAPEVKAYRGSAGLLHVAGRARGRLQSWQKWSFPAAAPSPGLAGRWSYGASPSESSMARRRVATPMCTSSSAVTATTIPTLTTVTFHLNCSASAVPTRSRRASPPTESTPSITGGRQHSRANRWQPRTSR